MRPNNYRKYGRNWSFKEALKKKSINQSLNQSITQSEVEVIEPASNTEYIRIQKDALELGLAAGYAGRSLHNIESTLERMESLMVTKDWMTGKLDEITNSHESNEQKRF